MSKQVLFKLKSKKISSVKRRVIYEWTKLRYGFFTGIHCQYLGNIQIHKSSAIGDFSTLTTSANGSIIISSSCSLGKSSWIAAGDGDILIGKNVLTGPNTVIVGQNHCLKDYTGQAPWERDGSGHVVYIGNNVHIGANAIILPGAHIADGSVIGANAIISKKYIKPSLIVGKDKLIKETPSQKIKGIETSKGIPYLHLSKRFSL